MRLWLAVVIIAFAWVFAAAYYVESDGVDCYPTCSASQDVAGAGVTLLPVAFVLVLVAAITRAVFAWRRRRL